MSLTALAPHVVPLRCAARRGRGRTEPRRLQRFRAARQPQRTKARFGAVRNGSHVASVAHPGAAPQAATLALSLPLWLSLSASLLSLLFGAVLVALLPVLHQVFTSAREVTRCTASVTRACVSVDLLATLLREDLAEVEKGLAGPLKAMQRSAEALPGVAPLQRMLDDPDAQLLRSVAEATRNSAEKGARSRLAGLANALAKATAQLAEAVRDPGAEE